MWNWLNCVDKKGSANKERGAVQLYKNMFKRNHCATPLIARLTRSVEVVGSSPIKAIPLFP